jgi:hypothetical protein
MRHKPIVDIFTIIFKGFQRVGFELKECEKYFYLSPAQVKSNTNIDIHEVELLIGSFIKPVFYKKGEKMLNDEICDIDNYLVKNFWITPSGTIEEMREKNKNKIILFKTIQKVFTFNRNDNNIVGFDTGDVKATFIYANRLFGLTKLDIEEIHILVGSYINPEYYQEGETMSDGEVCRKGGVLLKALNLRYSGTKEQMHEKFEENSARFSISNKGKHYYNEFRTQEEGVDYAINPLDGGYYDADWIADVFGKSPDDDIPWGNID